MRLFQVVFCFSFPAEILYLFLISLISATCLGNPSFILPFYRFLLNVSFEASHLVALYSPITSLLLCRYGFEVADKTKH